MHLAALLLALATASAADSTEAAYQRGVSAQRAGRTDEALAAWQRCLELDAAHVRCRWELGWTRWTLGEFDASVEAWKMVRQLDPAHAEVDRWLPKAQAHAAEVAAIRAAAAQAPETVRAPLPEGRTLRLRAVGDIMLGSDFPTPMMPPDDGATILEAVAPLLRDADVTFGNLEGPLCDGGSTKKCSPTSTVCYAFRTPTRYARYLEDAGFDLLSTANNHSGDFGEECRRQTEAALDRHGLAWSGPPGTVATLERGGFRIAMIAFHTSTACNYVNDHATAAALVSAAKALHDVVIVSFHGGAEGSGATRVPHGMEVFHGEQRGHLRAFARAVVKAGASVVLGHGPHVPRGLEVIDGSLVAYSLGNFATYGRFNLSGHLGTSLVLDVTLDHRGKLVEGRILPVRQEGKGVPVPDDEARAVALMVQLTREDFPETGPLIGRDGRFVPPP